MHLKRKGKELKEQWDRFLTDGDEDAFHDIYKHYLHYLGYIGLKKGAAFDQVQNCIADLFLYIWEQRVRLHHIHEHHNYLVTAFLRKLFRAEPFNVSYGDIDVAERPDLWDAPAEAGLIEREQTDMLRRILKKHLDQLPERQRQIVYQKFYLGLSYTQIAKSNNLSVNTVYNTMYIALAKLKKIKIHW